MEMEMREEGKFPACRLTIIKLLFFKRYYAGLGNQHSTKYQGNRRILSMLAPMSNHAIKYLSPHFAPTITGWREMRIRRRNVVKILSVSGLLFCLILPAVSTPQKTTEELIAPPAELSNTEDHRRMLDLLGIKELRRGANGSDKNAPNYANYDESKATPYPDLPELLVTNDGRKVTIPAMWWEGRHRHTGL